MTEDERSPGWAAYYDKLRDRPPRKTLLAALDAFGATPSDALALDLGCGDGRDAIEMLRRGWRVIAVDAEPEALRQLQARALPPDSDVAPVNARLEEVPIPIGVQLINSSFAMPLCEPGAFTAFGSASGKGFRLAVASAASGTARATAGSIGPASPSCVARRRLAMLEGLDLELFEEEESDGVTPRGTAKHWHIFHIVARKP